MPVIEFSDTVYETFNPCLDRSREENFTRLAGLLVNRRGPEMLDYAKRSGIDLNDSLEIDLLLASAKKVKHAARSDVRSRMEEAEKWRFTGYS